ncbi:MAG: hypothetical protein C5B50_17550 [Verrucomicrobia bacterium]|nr:MAG: hypothetical protein C5B50_17550 [Verrucomicrobiota bacterium]
MARKFIVTSLAPAELDKPIMNVRCETARSWILENLQPTLVKEARQVLRKYSVQGIIRNPRSFYDEITRLASSRGSSASSWGDALPFNSRMSDAAPFEVPRRNAYVNTTRGRRGNSRLRKRKTSRA